MKKRFSVLLVALIALALFGFASQTKVNANDDNIITYGDFEDLELGNLPDPANDKGYGSGNWDSYAQVVVDPLDEDNQVVKFSYTVEGKGFASFFKFATVKDGVTYEIELDYLVEGTTDNFGMRFAPICGDDVLKVFYSGAATDGWQHAKFELTTNKDGAYDSIGVWFNTGSNEANAGYIDNIVIKEKAEEVEPDPNIISHGDIEALELGNLPDPANAQGFGSGNWDSYAQVVADPLDEDNQVVKFAYTVEGKGFASFFKFATVKDGVTYEIELDYLVEGTTDNFGMRFAPICGDDVLKVFYSGAATDGWQHAKFELTTNKDGAYDSIGVWFNTGSNEANAGYIDNIVIKEKAEEVEPDPNIISHGDIEALELGNLPDPANAQGFGSGNWDSYAQVVADPLNADNKVIKFAYTVEGKGFASFFKFATVKDGVTYEIELDYLVVGSTDNFGMRFAPINGDDVLQVFYSGAATDGWQHAKFELTTNKDGAYDSIGVWFNTGSNEENAGYIDNIVIKEKEAEAPVDPVDPDPEPESPFDPNKTYYQSKTTTVNGDFEKFEVGTTFSEAQLEGAWGSVSLDMPGKIVTVDGSKVVDLTKTDDTHTYASCFLMLPDTLEVGDMLRLSYDIKLVINDEAASYTAIDSCFVGGANKSYYLINYKTIALAAGDSGKTSGNETIHYPVVITALENGWFNVTIDVQLTNKDLIQTNSIRWLFTPKSAEEHMYIDNVNIYMLSETPFNYDKAVESVRFNDGSSVSLKVGDEKTLAYTINPDDATDKSVTFTTSNANVASVDENGKVTAKAAGACSITITTANGKSAQIAVVVSAQAPTEEPATQPKTGCRAGKAILAEISLLCAVMFVVRKRKDLF